MSMRARRIALTLACLLLPGTVAAQYAAAPGARVRVVNVSNAAPVLTGQLIRMAGDTVIVSSATAIQTSMVVTSAHRFEVSTGRHGRTLRGIGIGLLAGVAVGTVAAYATYEEPECAPDSWFCLDFGGRGTEVAAGGILGGVSGMLIGGIVGATFRRETWRLIDHQPIRVGVAPTSHRGALLTLSLAF
jgi:hypothetical protein